MDPLDRGFGVPPEPIPASDSFRPLTKKVLLILPSYKTVSPLTAICVAQLSDRRRVALMQNFDDAFVAHTRNNCANEFLKTDYEYALWIDDDMVVPCGAANWFKSYCGWPKFPDKFAGLNAIDRLLSHNKKIVGALYFGRRPGGPPVYAEGMGGGKEAEYARTAPHDLVKPTNWIGFGCTLTHRSVFEDIEKKFPDLARRGKSGNWFTSSEHTLVYDLGQVRKMLSEGPMTGEKALKAYEMLEGAEKRRQAISGLGTGEDVIFCRRARECGHTVYVDLGLVCGHVGHRVYPENFHV